MVAAGSMVAAVEGLQMRMVGEATMSQKLTEQLAQTIRSDPVGTYVHDTMTKLWQSMMLKLTWIVTLQDCLRGCQEQIESLLETSLRQAQQQQHPVNMDTKSISEGQDLSATPTDVRDINIWKSAEDERQTGWTDEVIDKYNNFLFFFNTM